MSELLVSPDAATGNTMVVEILSIADPATLARGPLAQRAHADHQRYSTIASSSHRPR